MLEIQPWNRKSFAKGQPLTHIVDAGLAGIPDYVASVNAALQPLVGNEDMFHLPEFQTSVAKALVDHDSDVQVLANGVQERVMGGKRFAVVTNMGFTKLDDQTRDLFILGFNALLGSPTVTSPKDNRVLWPVRRDPVAEQLHRPTFSETDDEADFHSDSTWKLRPEQEFSLACVRMDGTGGGVSSLIDTRTMQGEIAATKNGIEVLDILRTAKVPFDTPVAFTNPETHKENDVFWAPILDGEVVRWNWMGIENGLRRSGDVLERDHEHAIEVWSATLNRRDLIHDFMLMQDSMVVVRNLDILHARSRVFDSDRFLLRARMDPGPRYSRGFKPV